MLHSVNFQNIKIRKYTFL